MDTNRLSTAYTALSTHLTNQTRILAQLTSHLMSPLTTILLPPSHLSEIDPFLTSTFELLPSLLPSSRPPQSLHVLLAETADLITDLNYLKDTLQVNQQTTVAAGRKLRAAKEVLRETMKEVEGRERSVAWLDEGGWDSRLGERRAASECRRIVSGFEEMCDGWGQRILAQEGGGIGIAI